VISDIDADCGAILTCGAMQKAETARKELAVLDAKRSNVINIGLTVLPPPNTIKAAILKMDSAIMNREGIEVSLAQCGI